MDIFISASSANFNTSMKVKLFPKPPLLFLKRKITSLVFSIYCLLIIQVAQKELRK